MNTILFSKRHGNHIAENANLQELEKFNSYEDAKIYLTKRLQAIYSEASTNDSFEDFSEEKGKYYAIYEEGDNTYVDRVFFNLDEEE